MSSNINNNNNDINKRVATYKDIYMMSLSDNFITLDSIDRYMNRYLECVNTLKDGTDNVDLFESRRKYYKRLTLLHCFSQLKLLDKYISDIDIKKNLTAFEERELEVYLSKISQIEKILNQLEPDINIMEVIVRGV